jgi:hypothetical protein
MVQATSYRNVLAALDVTDPRHVRGEGSVQLDASGAFDFMFPLGDRAELVRFRQGQGDAVLDLRKVPVLNKIEGLDFQAATARLGDARLCDPQVRREITNAATGTTFALTEDGLYMIRRPAIEAQHQMMTIAPN